MDQNTNYNQPAFEDEEPIDWALYISKFLANWRRIAVITCISGALGIVVALLQPRTWQVQMILAPEMQSGGGKSLSGSLGGIASMLGMGGALTGGSDAVGIALFPQICDCTPFLTGLFNIELTPYVTPQEMREGVVAQPTTLLKHLLEEDKPKSWFAELKESIFPVDSTLLEDESVVNIAKLTKKQNMALSKLAKMIKSEIDKKTSMATVTVELDDPMMATQLADSVCAHLTAFVFDYRTQKCREDLEYYDKMCEEAKTKMIAAQEAYGRAIDYNRNVQLLSLGAQTTLLENESEIATQVYSQMVSQRELTRAKLQESKPVFAVVEPATFPRRPMQSRSATVLGFGFLGFVLAAAWFLIGKDYYTEFMTELKNKKVEA